MPEFPTEREWEAVKSVRSVDCPPEWEYPGNRTHYHLLDGAFGVMSCLRRLVGDHE